MSWEAISHSGVFFLQVPLNVIFDGLSPTSIWHCIIVTCPEPLRICIFKKNPGVTSPSWWCTPRPVLGFSSFSYIAVVLAFEYQFSPPHSSTHIPLTRFLPKPSTYLSLCVPRHWPRLFFLCFSSEQSGADQDIAGRLLPQAGEAGRRDEPRTHRRGLRAWAQADSAVQWTRPQSLSEWERLSKESQWLAAPKMWTDIYTIFFFLALGNNLLPHIEANGPEPPASELTEERRGGGRGIRSLKVELVWGASHLSVSAVHS